MSLQNTLELAKQGDPGAIATILSYHLTQRYNITASVIRLGDYLSVLLEAEISPDPALVSALIHSIIEDLSIHTVNLVEISARKISDRNALWSQTIELNRTPLATMHDQITLISPTASAPASDSVESQTLASTASASTASASTASASTASASPIADDDDWSSTFQKLFQRPEMLGLIAFALMLVLWEAYTTVPDDTNPAQPISGNRLARRLGVHSSTISRYKTRPNFPAWSQDLDPDNIAWHFDGKAFIPTALPTADAIAAVPAALAASS
jgi:hypothetical protein